MTVDANDLERMAKEHPNERFLKGSGVLKLTGGIRQLEGQLRVSVTLLRECIGPLEVSAAVIESDDGDAMDALIDRVRSFVAAADGKSLVGLRQDDRLIPGLGDVDQSVSGAATGTQEVDPRLVNLGRDGAKHDGKEAASTGPHAGNGTTRGETVDGAGAAEQLREAADVANFAMMIADNARSLPSPPRSADTEQQNQGAQK